MFEMIVRITFKIYFLVLYRVRIYGLENVPKNGPALLCSNHVGQEDMFLIGYKLKRLVFWMAKEELFKIPLLSFFIRYFGAFPIKRGSTDIAAIKKTLNLLKEGNIVGIFPEGTRVSDRADSNPKSGAAMIALKANVPILPVSIKRKRKKFEIIELRFGEMFFLDNSKKYSQEELSKITKEIMDKIYLLMGEK